MPDNKGNKPKITFHYIKTNDYRSVLTTGAIGGTTLQGHINMNFYTDRAVIPRKVTYEIEDRTTLGKEVERDTREGVVREIQFGALFDVKTAKHLVEWLNEQINKIEKNKV